MDVIVLDQTLKDKRLWESPVLSATEGVDLGLPVNKYLHIHALHELNLQCAYISYKLKRNLPLTQVEM